MLFSPTFLVGAIGFFNVKKKNVPWLKRGWKTQPSTTTYFVPDAATLFSPPDFRLHGSERRGNGDVRLQTASSRSSRFRTTKRRRRRAARFCLPAPLTRPSACLLHRSVRTSPPSSRFQKTLTSHDFFAFFFFLFCFIMTKTREKVPSCVYRCENYSGCLGATSLWSGPDSRTWYWTLRSTPPPHTLLPPWR